MRAFRKSHTPLVTHYKATIRHINMPLVMSEAAGREAIPNGHHLTHAARLDAGFEFILRPSMDHPPSTPYQ